MSHTDILPDSLIYSIKSPDDLKELSLEQLGRISDDIRIFLLESISHSGGHFSSNLGVVELTVALHYVFNSPKDKLIFDVGHQSYVHKILTGRLQQFDRLRQKGGISGFPRRCESPHDISCSGHASVAPSTALGILAGDRMQGRANKVIAIIGDAGMGGGMAFEALNHGGHLQKDLIIILNDNEMSIDKNVGALHNYLSNTTAAKPYQQVRLKIENFFKILPFGMDKAFYNFGVRCKKALKALFFKETLFSDLGFEYAGPINGHDLKAMIKAFNNAIAINRPIVIHVITQKGRGYEHAITNPGSYHGVTPFNLVKGIEKKASSSFTSAFGDSVYRLGTRDKRIVVVTAAMGDGTGLKKFGSAFPDRYYDVGIAEAHAIAFASGLATSGLKPIVAIYSTFMQRAVDQVIHDLAIQGVPVILAMDRAGLVPGDGETHQGLYDISLFKAVPGINFLAPATAFELDNMMRWALRQKEPTLLRYPKDALPTEHDACSSKIVRGRGVFIKQSKSSNIIILSLGSMMQELLTVVSKLNKEGLEADLYNLRFITPLDEEHLLQVMKRYRMVVVVEEAMKSGGIGETIAVITHKLRRHTAFLHLATASIHYGHATRPELFKMAGLSAPQMSKAISNAYTDFRVRVKADQLFL